MHSQAHCFLWFLWSFFTAVRRTFKFEKLIAYDKNRRIHMQIWLKLLLIHHLQLFGLQVKDDSLSWSFPWNSAFTSKFFQASVQKEKINNSWNHYYLLGHFFFFLNYMNFLKQRPSQNQYWFLSFRCGKMECSSLRKQNHENISKRIPQSHTVCSEAMFTGSIQVTSLGQLSSLWSSFTNIPVFNLSKTDLPFWCLFHQCTLLICLKI